MDRPPPLAGILETVLYCTTETAEAIHHFYSDTLGLRRISEWGYRLGSQILLLFNADETRDQEWPPAHGASGKGHMCFTVSPSGYEDWKKFLEGQGVVITEEIDWSRGVMSFYFEDPAGNVLEISNGDMWPA